MKAFTLLIVGILSCNLLFGAHFIISGQVLDQQTKEPLIGASVFITNTARGVDTDEMGKFSIKADSAFQSISVAYLGYETQEIPLIKSKDFLTVYLSPGTLNLESVAISSQQKSLSSISKIDVNIRPIKSSQDVLRAVPGLFIGQHAGGGKAEQIFLRGFDIDHGTDIAINVDGMPVNMVSHAHGQGYADLHFLIPETIDKIDFGKIGRVKS